MAVYSQRMSATPTRRFTISAANDSDIPEVRRLFLEYQDWLGFSLCFQGFDQELATLPGKYAPPAGALLVARDPAGALIGCVALRPTPFDGICEMKRLYVSPAARGSGLGRELLRAILDAARERNYKAIRLDTVPGKMDRAIEMYRAVEFEEIPAYYDAPMEHVLFLEKKL